MSFSKEQKAAVLKESYKLPCCRRSFLVGILLSKGECREGKIFLRTDGDESAEALLPLISEAFGRDADVTTPALGGRGREISFFSPSAERLLLRNKEGILYYPSLTCTGCRNAFFAGIFYAVGRVSDPKKQFCLEFSFGSKTNLFKSFFEETGLSPKYARRREEQLLYFRDSASIEDYFALAGMNRTAFLFMNFKIENEFRNNANRVANCETNNIQKAVVAGALPIAKIEELERRELLSRLPEELERTARLRLLYRDLSLYQLAQKAVPPITKSGLSHRLSKIVKLADELLAEPQKS